MTHVILTGATGTAGSAVLARCIASPSITRISILSRRPVKQAADIPKAHVLIHEDYTTYPDTLLQQLKGATGCIWAQGIPSNQAPNAAAYERITHDFPLAAARAFHGLAPRFNFVYISGEGANRSPPGRFTPLFARVKGQTENALLALLPEYPGLRVYNVRPAMIDDTQGPRLRDSAPKPLTYRMIEKVAPVMRALWPSGVSPTGKLAEVLVELVEEGGDAAEVRKKLEGKGVTWDAEGTEAVGVLMENTGIRRLAGL